MLFEWEEDGETKSAHYFRRRADIEPDVYALTLLKTLEYVGCNYRNASPWLPSFKEPSRTIIDFYVTNFDE